jgi:hypothetical protein
MQNVSRTFDQAIHVKKKLTVLLEAGFDSSGFLQGSMDPFCENKEKERFCLFPLESQTAIILLITAANRTEGTW